MQSPEPDSSGGTKPADPRMEFAVKRDGHGRFPNPTGPGPDHYGVDQYHLHHGELRIWNGRLFPLSTAAVGNPGIDSSARGGNPIWLYTINCWHPGHGACRRLALVHAAPAPEGRGSGADPMAAQHHGRHNAIHRGTGSPLAFAGTMTGDRADKIIALTLLAAPSGGAR